MSENEKPPAVVAFPTPTPKSESDPPEKIGLFPASVTLRDFLTQVIDGDYANLDRSVAAALCVIDPGGKAPPLVRYAGRMHMRKIAGEIALGREKPTMGSAASYAVIAFDRESRTIRTPAPPPAKAHLQLDLIEAGVCNLCSRIHDEPGLFAMTWVDDALGLEIRALFGASCVSEAIFREIHRRENSENWIRAQAQRTGRKVRRADDA